MGARHLPVLVLMSCALTGCGVDCTRTMWEHPWMGDRPERHRAAWQSGKVAEYGAKGVITPLAVTVDVVTDERFWQAMAVVGWLALEVVCAAGGGGSCGDCHFGSGQGGGGDHGHGGHHHG